MAEEKSKNQDRRNSARPCNDKYHNVWMTPMGVQHIRALRLGSEGQTTRKIPYLQLKQLMQLRHAHICPHLRMSDKQVYQSAKSKPELVALSGFHHFKELAKAAARTRTMQLGRLVTWPLGGEHKYWCCSCCPKDRCKKCGATWHFFMTSLNQDLFLSVQRPFIVSGMDDPYWLKQTVLPEQAVRLDREWEEDIRAFEARSGPRGS